MRDIIDGKAIAAELRGKVAEAVSALQSDHGVVPGIAVVLVGNDPASEVYVRNKSKAVAEAGMRAFDRKLPATISEAELIDADRPAQCRRESQRHSRAIAASKADRRANDALRRSIRRKDVDGFHPVNAGRLATGLPALVPCTPFGCVILAKTVHHSLAGMEAVVIGRSNIVGKPVAQLLLAENATVTIAHSKNERSCRPFAAAPTCWSLRSAGRKWFEATGSSRARR